MNDEIATTPRKPIFPELQDARLRDIGSFFDDAMDRAQRATRFEQQLRAAKRNANIALAPLVAAVIVLFAIILWQKHTLDNINQDKEVAQRALSGIRAHTFGAGFSVNSRGHFITFPTGTRFETTWSCPSQDGHMEPCVQVISPQ